MRGFKLYFLTAVFGVGFRFVSHSGAFSFTDESFAETRDDNRCQPRLDFDLDFAEEGIRISQRKRRP